MSGIFDSFKSLPHRYQVGQLASFLHNENLILQSYQHAWENAGDSVEWARRNEGLVDWNIGKKIAALEFAAYLFQYPQFVIFAGQTPSLFRLLRGAELSGALKRGGNTTLIGSGVTIPEILATHLYPPSQEAIQELHEHGTMEELEQKLDEVLKETPSPLNPPLRFLSGDITAIEPEQDALKEAEGNNKRVFHIPNRLNLMPITLDKALRKKRIPQSEVILLNRADPRIFGSTKNDWARTLDEILSYIKSGGYFVLTVGTGNRSHKDYERNLRLDLLNWLSEILPNRGLPVTTPGGKANFVDYGDDSSYYGGPYGMIGYIIGCKSTI